MNIIKTLLLIILMTLALSTFSLAQGSEAVLRRGSALPITCLPASRNILFYKTGSSSGFYICLTANTWTSITGSGAGDTVSSVGSSVDSEIALFSGTGGKTIKRSSGTGFGYLTSGVLSAVTTIPNTITANLKDTLFTLQDDGDATKLLRFQLSGITTGTTRTLTVPDASDTVAVLGTAQTFTGLQTYNGGMALNRTVTAALTTGAQTINKQAGTVNVAASGTSLVVTNSLVTASSIISVLARTNDSTCAVKNYVPTSGSFTINMTAACTAETSVGFIVFN